MISSVLDVIDSVAVDYIVVAECVVECVAIGVVMDSVIIRGVADSIVTCVDVDSDIASGGFCYLC